MESDCKIVTVNKMQYIFLPENGTTDALYVFRIFQKMYCAEEKKLCMCFVYQGKVFERIPRK